MANLLLRRGGWGAGEGAQDAGGILWAQRRGQALGDSGGRVADAPAAQVAGLLAAMPDVAHDAEFQRLDGTGKAADADTSLSANQECAGGSAPAPTLLTRCDVPGV